MGPVKYGELLRKCYEAHTPLFVSGGPGIGKSAIPRQVFCGVAEAEKRIFVEWSDLTLAKKKEVLDKPDLYWVFADMRTSQMDTTSLVGIPNMNNSEMLENIPYSWVIYFTSKEAAGCIFFDEINLAAPIVQSITYSAIHDRVISDRRLSDGVYIFAAGNRSQDRAHTFDMPLPLRDRFCEAEIHHDTSAWLEWAARSGINPHLVAFIQWKPSNLYTADKASKDDKPTTPRGVERASRLIGHSSIVDRGTYDLVAVSCGETFATEFTAYCKIYSAIEWSTLLAKPSIIRTLSLDTQYAVTAGIAERWVHEWKKLPKTTKARGASDFKDIKSLLELLFEIANAASGRVDMAMLGFAMITGLADGKTNLREALVATGLIKPFTDKFAKYTLTQQIGRAQ